MELLLKNDFTTFYGLPTLNNVEISKVTEEEYFELKDDIQLVYTVHNQGIAKYSNENAKQVTVINYELFFNSLSAPYIQGKEKCDLIVFDNNNDFFLLNELTDTLLKYVNPYTNTKGSQQGKRYKAIAQLLSSLSFMISVPSIRVFINSYQFRYCCFFNKQPTAPAILNATTAFNRLGTLTNKGFKMSVPEIEQHGFEFWEYSGNQIFEL